MLLNCVLEKIFESPLDCKVIKPVNPKGNQSWIFNRMTDAKAETPILWPPDVKNWLIGKDPVPGKHWRGGGAPEDEMVGWHHWLNWHKFEQTPGDSERQGSLACCSPWGHKESDMTESLIWTDIWNLEKWSWWTYLQGRNRDADRENGLVDTMGKVEGGTNWEQSIDTYIQPCIK